jgi:recombinational DNA repair ATPase RecF
MAIIFEKIQWKNFLSTGDTPISINLNTGCSTLIVGPNGAGKSTLLDALSFALFGKPHRDINKPQLVNSVNGKGCEVVVEFTVGKAEFKIVRGIKPSIFEIWQNGTLVNQEAHFFIRAVHAASVVPPSRGDRGSAGHQHLHQDEHDPEGEDRCTP